MKGFHLPFILIPVAVVSGCVMVTPSIFYPSTSVHGLVLDQDGKRVPNVNIEVRKHWPYSLIVYPTSTSKWYIRSDDQGRWNVSTRKVGGLYVEVMPPNGYKPMWPENTEKQTIAGPFGSGDCPTNDFVLRLEKTVIPEKGAK